MTAVIALALIPTIVYVVSAAMSARNGWRSAAFYRLLKEPEPNNWFVAHRWHYPLELRRTDGGLQLLVSPDHRCARGTLPCTSHFASNLRLRKADDLASGFSVDGGWKAEGYPNPWGKNDFIAVWRQARAQGYQ